MGELDDTAPASEGGGPPPDPRLGTTVGKCTIVRLLGKGGMGAVYEGRHTQLSRRFAIKFLLPEYAAHKEVLGRFEGEAKAAGGLEHPNLIAVTDVGRADDGAPYLVMEYLQGEDCAHLLRRVGPLPAMRAADLVLQACRGLAVAHKAGIVHRDLKPENLFVTDAGDGSDRIKVLDFGIAQIRSPDRGRVTRTGATLGTPHYMSPEQARGDADLDSRTDVWSLGVVLYELLSGRRPFDGERFLHVVHQILSTEPAPLATLRPGLAPSLVSLVERAMTKNVAERLPSVTAFAEALLPFAGRTSLPPVQEAAGGPAQTMATPATVAGLSASLAPRTGLTAARSQPSVTPSMAGTSRGSGAMRWGIATVAVAAAVVAAGVVVPRLRSSDGPSGGVGAASAGPPPESAPSIPPSPAGAASAASASNGQGSGPIGLAGPTVTGASGAPVAAVATAEPGPDHTVRDGGVGGGVHPVSEPFEPRSNKPPAAPPAQSIVRTSDREGPPAPVEVHPIAPAPVPKPDIPKETASSQPQASEPAAPAHHTKIDRANPY